LSFIERLRGFIGPPGLSFIERLRGFIGLGVPVECAREGTQTGTMRERRRHALETMMISITVWY
jgi:hypothetical protein